MLAHSLTDSRCSLNLGPAGPPFLPPRRQPKPPANPHIPQAHAGLTSRSKPPNTQYRTNPINHQKPAHDLPSHPRSNKTRQTPRSTGPPRAIGSSTPAVATPSYTVLALDLCHTVAGFQDCSHVVVSSVGVEAERTLDRYADGNVSHGMDAVLGLSL